MTPALEVVRLSKTFGGGRSLFGRAKPQKQAVRCVSFRVAPGETLGIVGESGCGKTTLARMLVGLLPSSSGQIRIEGEELSGLSGGNQLARRIQYVFQDPLGSLNPRKKIRQIMEAPLRHLLGMEPAARTARIMELFDAVNLRKEFLDRYPHEFSGGQAQRIGIARALAANPRIVVFDEPVSALDVSVQAQVLNLLTDLREAYNLTYLFISHDLAVVEAISDRVAVLYCGSIVELADAADIFTAPRHPYTLLLADSAPVIGKQLAKTSDTGGEPLDTHTVPAGCAFAKRCGYARDECRRTDPEPTYLRGENHVRCFHPIKP